MALNTELNKLKAAIFDTPVLSNMFHYLARFLLRLFGCKVEGAISRPAKIRLGRRAAYIQLGYSGIPGDSLRPAHKRPLHGQSGIVFRSPLGWFFHWCGGIPVDRIKSRGIVEQMVQACQESDRYILTIAPEGMHHKVRVWKMDFYHIAKNAGIPLVLIIVDGDRKMMRVG